MMLLHSPRLLGHHVFGEPDVAAGVNVDADADAVQGRAEQVNAMPATQRLVRHAFLNGVDTAPGRRIRTGHPDAFSAVAPTGEAFVGDALVWRHAVGTVMAEAAVRHVPAMQQRARGQRVVPGKGGQSAGGALAINQVEKLLSELLGFT